ncbi:MAG: DUF3109 family protein [Bacteroidota bacterium]
MIIIQDVLISEDVIEKEFICNLSACKGACCWEGDYGAPVTEKEQSIIESNLDKIRPNLSVESNQLLDEEGSFAEYSKDKFTGTALHPNGACVFMTFDDQGIAKCGIEKTYEEGKISYKKPMSCHLYPIRVTINEPATFEAWNYDQWDICSAACALGKKESVPIYQFLKEAIIRYKGEEFYEELDHAVKYLKE